MLHLSDTALIDSAEYMTLMNKTAKANVLAVQETNKHLTIPNGDGTKATETLIVLLNKLPIAAQRAFRIQDIHNNLLAVCELCNIGCGVNFHPTDVTVDYNGETVLQGWRDPQTGYFRYRCRTTIQIKSSHKQIQEK